MTHTRRHALIAGLVAVLLGSGAVAAPRVNGVILDRSVPVPPFSLDDHDGNPFTVEQLKGRWSLILAGFTSCPDVCPFTLANLEQVVAETLRTNVPELLAAIAKCDGSITNRPPIPITTSGMIFRTVVTS